MTSRKTTWEKGQSGNPKGRPPIVSRARELLDSSHDDLVKKAKEMALAGDTTALRLCLDRVSPLPRSVLPSVEIPGLAEAITMSDKARAIVDAAGLGTISPDSASMLLGAIASTMKIIEVEEISERISRLEEGIEQ